jgi:hypothetical protein
VVNDDGRPGDGREDDGAQAVLRLGGGLHQHEVRGFGTVVAIENPCDFHAGSPQDFARLGQLPADDVRHRDR